MVYRAYFKHCWVINSITSFIFYEVFVPLWIFDLEPSNLSCSNYPYLTELLVCCTGLALKALESWDPHLLKVLAAKNAAFKERLYYIVQLHGISWTTLATKNLSNLLSVWDIISEEMCVSEQWVSLKKGSVSCK